MKIKSSGSDGTKAKYLIELTKQERPVDHLRFGETGPYDPARRIDQENG